MRKGTLALLLLVPSTSPSLAAPPASDAGSARPRDAATEAAPDARRETEPLTERLNQELASSQRNAALSEASDPVLQPERDGSYTYRGNGINATIEPDGSVRFDDKFVEGFRFDLTAWADKLAGNDPFRSERRWFLERTRTFREQLACRHMVAAARLSGRSLERVLTRIWQSPSLNCERRKQETLRLWAAASLSKQPETRHATIERFVQARSATDRICPWTIQELREVDAQPLGCEAHKATPAATPAAK